MLQTEIQQAVRGTWWALVIRGLFGLAIGLFIFARPVESVAAFALVIALWALVQGVVNVVHAFDLQGVVEHWWLLLVGGLLSIGFGIAALYYYPALSLSFAVVWTAWWLLLAGGVGIYAALQERQLGLPWGWTLVWGLLGVAGGIFAFVSPPITLAALMGFLAAFAVVSGIALLVAAFRLRQAESDVTATLRTA